MAISFTSAVPWKQQYHFNESTATDITGWTTGTSLPVAFRVSSAIVTKNRVYLLGGYTTASVSTVYTAPINEDGTLGTWTTGTSLPGVLCWSTVVMTKTRVYLLGGLTTPAVATVYTAPINEDGTLGTWTTGTSLPGALTGSSAIVTKNRVYLLGGHISAAVSTVYTAPINEDGTLGTWTTGTSLPGVLRESGVVVTSNRVYLCGGYAAAAVATVYTAPINEDGTLGTWTTGTSLPGVLVASSSLVTKNRVYLLGGLTTVAVSTVYTAPINADGTLGTWTTGTSLPGALSSSSAIVTSSKIYLLGGYSGSSSVATVYQANFSGGFNDYLNLSWELITDTLVTVSSYFEQLYGLSVAAAVSQYYGDYPIQSNFIDQYYSDAASPVRFVTQVYEDAEIINSFIDDTYTLTHELVKVLEQPNSISSGVVKNTSDAIYELSAYNKLDSTLSQVYSVLPKSTDIKDVSSLTINGVTVKFISADIRYSQSSYIVTGSVTLAHRIDWVNTLQLDDVVLHTNGTNHNLIVIAKTKAESNEGLSFNIELASPAILLSFPYAAEIPEGFTISGTMSQIANSVAALEGLSVVWEIPVDDVLTSDDIQVDGKAPIDVIKEIVNELGGVLQSYPDGSIHAVRRYKVDSDKYSPTLAVKTYSTGIDFISLEEETEKRDGHNKFSVTNVSVSKSWNFESERINDSSYKLKAYKVPWTSDIPVVTTSELTNVTISNIIGPVSEELEEEIEIVSGAGSVDKPCYSVNLVDYKTSTNLGAVTISEDGSVSTTTPGNSMVTIKYVTRYWAWNVYDSDKETVQFILDA